MEYSAVTHPSPLPIIHRGTFGLTLAVHSTQVFPISIRTDPGVVLVYWRVIFTARSSSAGRCRMEVSYASAVTENRRVALPNMNSDSAGSRRLPRKRSEFPKGPDIAVRADYHIQPLEV